MFLLSTTGISLKAGLNASIVNIINPKTLSYSEIIVFVSVSINNLTIYAKQLSSEWSNSQKSKI